MFRGSVKSSGYPLHSPVSPSLPLPCVTVCHHISTEIYLSFDASNCKNASNGKGLFLVLQGFRHVSHHTLSQTRLFRPRHCSTTSISDIKEMTVQNSGRPIYGDKITAPGLDEMLIPFSTRWPPDKQQLQHDTTASDFVSFCKRGNEPSGFTGGEFLAY
jgi:hypothetical protein